MDQEEQRLLNSEAILRNLIAEFKRQGIKVKKIDEDTFSYKGIHFDLQDAPTDTLNGIVYLIAPSKQTIPVREENLAETVKMVIDYAEYQHELKSAMRKIRVKKYAESMVTLPDPITLYVNGQRYELRSDPAYIITTMDFRKAEIRMDDIIIVARIETKEPFFTYDWSVIAYHNDGWKTKLQNVAPYHGFNIPIEEGITTNFREVEEALDHVMHDYRMQSISGYHPDYNASAKKSAILSKNDVRERVRMNNATHNKNSMMLSKRGVSLKAETKGLDADQIGQPIRDWYVSAYPDDDLGSHLSDITFDDLHSVLSNGDDIYDRLGIRDSLMRERIFQRLADIKRVPYNSIYQTWVGKGVRKSAMLSKNGNFNVGDILVSSWGYDQTNVQWYQVVGVTSKSVKIREIKGRVRETGFMSGESVPIPDAFINNLWFGEQKTARVNPHGWVNITSDGYITARKWDGNPEYVSWYA